MAPVVVIGSWFLSLFSVVAVGQQNQAVEMPDALAEQVLDESGITGGFIVLVGTEDGRFAKALKASDSFQVHALDRDFANVDRSRSYLRSEDAYGAVSVDHFQGSALPYVENLVNLVVSENLGDVPMSEVMRVLAPNGVSYIKTDGKWEKTVKPRPDDIDSWTHFMHDATGNAVAHDEQVGPPTHLQWVGSPRWSRHHDRMASMSALVSAGGRIFYIMDEGSRASIQLPPKWTVIARDAFNGTILWKRPFENWQNHLWPLKSGPTQLARRLVTDGDKLYVTLGLEAPLIALDSATGEVIQTFEGSAATEEIIESNGQLFLLVNEQPSQLREYAPQHNVGDQKRVATEFNWNGVQRKVHSYDAESGELLWEKETYVAPITMCANDEFFVFHDGEKVVCLDRTHGREVWSSPPAGRRRAFTMNFGPKLVLYDDVVLFAGGDRMMHAYSIATGEELWNAPHAQSGYQSPEDVLVSNGLVWSGETTSGKLVGVFSGRDPRTGEVKIEFPPDVSTYWFHHRCYISKATDKYLLPSRTGIEFVDPSTEHWEINHWVRGGCLYGILPCNGLVYTPPHNCACYPEAKLFGFNSLAAKSESRTVPDVVPEEGRLEKGPAFLVEGQSLVPSNLLSLGDSRGKSADDWPTFRHDDGRSGRAPSPVAENLKPSWKTKIGGKLSTLVVADNKVFVAQIDEHLLHAMDEATGELLWSFTTGARIDSPPTICKFKSGDDAIALCVFGSNDGYVYCVRASDGELVWKYRAAPVDQRVMAYEQLESVWPVSGSILVEDGIAYFVAGRSNFLDGGLRWIKLDVRTGEKLAELVIDEQDPDSNGTIQDRLQILQMPTGLPDILSSDDKWVYMRSQKFDRDGKRYDLGPHSGLADVHGGTQRGEGVHLFSPSGYLDSSYFHRSYWVFGRSFAGGHNGYYQAGKYAPAGRMLVFDDSSVFGFGRKPEYLKWTTTLEHQLFRSSKEPPLVAKKGPRPAASMVKFEKTASLDPTGKPITVEAWVKADAPNGVVVAHGGPTHGYALVVNGGKPAFLFRRSEEFTRVASAERVVGRWVHLVGVLSEDHNISLYVDGQLTGTADVAGLIPSDPAQGLQVGGDDGSAVGNYNSPYSLTGTIDEVRVYHRALDADEVEAHFESGSASDEEGVNLVLACSFEQGEGQDDSGNANHGAAYGNSVIAGKYGNGIRLSGRKIAASGNSYVKREWVQDVPLFAIGMLLADKTLYVAGPPDLIDEEETFARLVMRDPTVQQLLNQQDEAWEGQQGAVVWGVSIEDGSLVAEYHLDSLPVWDGMISAGGKMYFATADGHVIRMSGK